MQIENPSSRHTPVCLLFAVASLWLLLASLPSCCAKAAGMCGGPAVMPPPAGRPRPEGPASRKGPSPTLPRGAELLQPEPPSWPRAVLVQASLAQGGRAAGAAVWEDFSVDTCSLYKLALCLVPKCRLFEGRGGKAGGGACGQQGERGSGPVSDRAAFLVAANML